VYVTQLQITWLLLPPGIERWGSSLNKASNHSTSATTESTRGIEQSAPALTASSGTFDHYF
jgi:hypothetical protein